MRIGFLAALMVIALVTPGAQAAPAMRAPEAIGLQDLPQIQLLSSSERGVDLVFELPTLGVEQFPSNGRDFSSISIPGGGIAGAIGTPMLPTFPGRHGDCLLRYSVCLMHFRNVLFGKPMEFWRRSGRKQSITIRSINIRRGRTANETMLGI